MTSDRRAYVRIPDAILSEPWDDATLADMVRLQCFLNTRWARLRLTPEEAGRAFLGNQEMMLITRTTHPARARKRCLTLHRRAVGVHIAVTEATQGRHRGVYIDWPKFPQEQGYRYRGTPQVRANLGPLPPPPPPPHKKEPPAPAKPGAPPREKLIRKTEAPDELSPQGRARVLDWMKLVMASQVGCADAYIERALGYYRGDGKRYVSWPDAVINNIRALENRRREREGEQPLMSCTEARELQAKVIDIRQRNEKAKAEAASARAWDSPERSHVEL